MADGMFDALSTTEVHGCILCRPRGDMATGFASTKELRADAPARRSLEVRTS